MQQYQIKNQSDAIFSTFNHKLELFQVETNLSISFSFFQQNQSSKFKIPKLNNQEAKSIFSELNHKTLIKQSSSKKNWKFQQTCLLVYLVQKFLSFQQISNLNQFTGQIWQHISSFLPSRSARDCKYKVLSLTASTITNIPWSTEERNILTQIIQQQGMNWNVISQQLYQKSDKKIFRTSKQCREHYMCFLKPNLKKGAWTQQQDYKLVSLFLEFGRKWSKIMKFIEGRNQNSIKNRFFLLFENKGKTSNQSDLLRKVKRKKQRMEKSLKDVEFNFKLPINQRAGQHPFEGQPWDKTCQMEIEKQEIEGETKKGDQLQLSEYLSKYEQKQSLERKQTNQYEQNRNRLSLSNLNSYQHLDFCHLDMGNKEQESIGAFQSFQQYICF